MLPLRRGIATMAGKFRLALVQMMVSQDKQSNLDKAAKLVSEAAQNGANIVALPECFNSPYGTSFFKQYSETIPGNTTSILSEIAKKSKVFLIGGSIPESSDGKLFNCSTVYNDQGELIAKFRKMHLFDIDVPGKITFKESTTLSPGDNFCVFQTPFCKVGLGICYDIRFPEVAQIYANQGCDLIIYPGAFNMTTGPAHWELLVRSRAADNQVYSAVVSPARDETSSYVAWGHSTVAGPWGDVLGKLDEKEGILYTDIDLNRATEVRQQIPTRNQKRHDVYVGSKQLS